MQRRGALLTAFALTQLVLRGAAQVQVFQWTFGNNFILTEISECQMLPIVVSSIFANDSTKLGTPPYYLLAFELGGVPTTTMVGTDPTKLSWQANHARGSSLMLTMVDSTGNTGGVTPNLYSMTAGTSTSCLPSNPPLTSLASISPNVTGPLTTCQPWGLTITGGTKPYSVVLSARNSHVITNVTMGAQDDVFTFIDRADPGTALMANVVDATGQWGKSTNVVNTTGPTSVDCVGLVSSSKTQQQIQQEAIDQAAAAAAAARHRHNMRIVSIVLGVCIPLLVIAGALAFWWRRRAIIAKDHDRGVWDGQDVNARVWELPPGSGEMVQVGDSPQAHHSLLDHKRSGSGEPGSDPNIALRAIIPSTAYAQYSPDYDGLTSPGQSSSASQIGSQSPQPTTTTATTSAYPTALTPRQRKALEAQGITPSSSSTHLPPGALPPSSPGTSGPRSPRTMTPADSLDNAAGPDIIIQHRDAGAGPVVQELPPPYMNRATGSAS
ncbi:hypothetical protein EIP91_000172 [Steccherinum ochraceum]|uniref:Mid2 domain-containing protein n=1 Tax=Steccherinum ochraceum TaxID=92696 RepID=A0A4R0RQB2_9APHY|nr:hypothetical protein EIP91_000172 [Steccherinum ochraceum]